LGVHFGRMPQTKIDVVERTFAHGYKSTLPFSRGRGGILLSVGWPPNRFGVTYAL
jgi:hypothetical protein